MSKSERSNLYKTKKHPSILVTSAVSHIMQITVCNTSMIKTIPHMQCLKVIRPPAIKRIIRIIRINKYLLGKYKKNSYF